MQRPLKVVEAEEFGRIRSLVDLLQLTRIYLDPSEKSLGSTRSQEASPENYRRREAKPLSRDLGKLPEVDRIGHLFGPRQRRTLAQLAVKSTGFEAGGFNSRSLTEIWWWL